MKPIVIAGAALSALALAACGSSNGPASFVGRASNAAFFIQWTRNGSQLSGSMEEAILQNDQSGSSTPNSVSSTNYSLTGTISGSGVTLSLDQGGGNLTGTLNGNQLALSFPGQNSGVITVDLTGGIASGFNRDVADLQGQATRANNQTQRAQAAQQTAQQVYSDAQAVATDLSDLQSYVSEANGTSTLASDLAQTRTDLAQTLTDLQLVQSEVGQNDDGGGTLCANAGAVSSDASGVQSDYAGLQSDHSGVQSDASGITPAIKQLQQDNAILDNGRATESADVPTGAPTDAQVAAAIKAANAKLSGEYSAVDSALTQGKQMVSTANGYASTAEADCNSAEASG
ncbi:MAG: hypothetical protein ABSG64_01160 [Solirubrobacteraceae bacterium]|jgi:hypothetical protein